MNNSGCDETNVSLQRIIPTRKTGDESFVINGKKLNASLEHFWQWSSSDILNNTLRGTLSEYIVALSLGVADGVQEGWKSYDLEYKALKIEVKSSAYIQSWGQKTYSKILFNVPPTKAFDFSNGVFSHQSMRQADLYVFCILTEKDIEKLNPLDLDQWDFYIVQTRELDAAIGAGKTVGLVPLKKIPHVQCGFSRLKQQMDHFISDGEFI